MSCVMRDDSYEPSFSPSSIVMTGLMRSYRYSYASSAYFSEYSMREDELIFDCFAPFSLGRLFEFELELYVWYFKVLGELGLYFSWKWTSFVWRDAKLSRHLVPVYYSFFMSYRYSFLPRTSAMSDRPMDDGKRCGTLRIHHALRARSTKQTTVFVKSTLPTPSFLLLSLYTSWLHSIVSLLLYRRSVAVPVAKDVSNAESIGAPWR